MFPADLLMAKIELVSCEPEPETTQDPEPRTQDPYTIELVA
jgi:hypothetical protein